MPMAVVKGAPLTSRTTCRFVLRLTSVPPAPPRTGNAGRIKAYGVMAQKNPHELDGSGEFLSKRCFTTVCS
jgi:hypothetical protein